MNNTQEKMSTKITKPSSVKTQKPDQLLPFTTTFSIYINGVKRDFTRPKYHNQSTKAYITSQNPSQIIVTEEGLTWQDFFDTLPEPMKISSSCITTGLGENFCTTSKKSLTFMVNGINTPTLLTEEILPEDKLQIIYNNKDESDSVLGTSTSSATLKM